MWNGKLFRKTAKGVRLVPCVSTRSSTLMEQQYNTELWDLGATSKVITDRCRWPGTIEDIYNHVKPCNECQKAKFVPKFRTSLMLPSSALFGPFAIGFAGSLPLTKNGNKYVPVAVENLSNWPLIRILSRATIDDRLKFVQEEVIQNFGYPKLIMSGSNSSFMFTKLKADLENSGV